MFPPQTPEERSRGTRPLNRSVQLVHSDPNGDGWLPGDGRLFFHLADFLMRQHMSQDKNGDKVLKSMLLF